MFLRLMCLVLLCILLCSCSSPSEEASSLEAQDSGHSPSVRPAKTPEPTSPSQARDVSEEEQPDWIKTMGRSGGGEIYVAENDELYLTCYDGNVQLTFKHEDEADLPEFIHFIYEVEYDADADEPNGSISGSLCMYDGYADRNGYSFTLYSLDKEYRGKPVSVAIASKDGEPEKLPVRTLTAGWYPSEVTGIETDIEALLGAEIKERAKINRTGELAGYWNAYYSPFDGAERWIISQWPDGYDGVDPNAEDSESAYDDTYPTQRLGFVLLKADDGFRTESLNTESWTNSNLNEITDVLLSRIGYMGVYHEEWINMGSVRYANPADFAADKDESYPSWDDVWISGVFDGYSLCNPLVNEKIKAPKSSLWIAPAWLSGSDESVKSFSYRIWKNGKFAGKGKNHGGYAKWFPKDELHDGDMFAVEIKARSEDEAEDGSKKQIDTVHTQGFVLKKVLPSDIRYLIRRAVMENYGYFASRDTNRFDVTASQFTSLGDSYYGWNFSFYSNVAGEEPLEINVEF